MEFNNYFPIARRLGRGACRFVRRSNNFQANIILINAIGDYDFRFMTEHFIRFVIRWEGVLSRKRSFCSRIMTRHHNNKANFLELPK
jgi:hypothetical protein